MELRQRACSPPACHGYECVLRRSFERRSYAAYDFSLIYTNVIVGIAAVSSRVFLLLASLALFIPRLDYSTMPGPEQFFYSIDAGLSSYLAMLALDHRCERGETEQASAPTHACAAAACVALLTAQCCVVTPLQITTLW
jgi:hypothetical protein